MLFVQYLYSKDFFWHIWGLLEWNECTVGEWEFIFDRANSKASNSTEQFRNVFSIDIKSVGFITKMSTWKIKSEMLGTAGIQCICQTMAQTYAPSIWASVYILFTVHSKCQNPSLQPVHSVFQVSEPKSTACSVCSKHQSPNLQPFHSVFQVSQPKSAACSQCVPSVTAQVYILLVFQVSESKSTSCSVFSKCQSPSLQPVCSVFQVLERTSATCSQHVPSVRAQAHIEFQVSERKSATCSLHVPHMSQP